MPETPLERRLYLANRAELYNVSLRMKINAWELVRETALEVGDEKIFDFADNRLTQLEVMRR